MKRQLQNIPKNVPSALNRSQLDARSPVILCVDDDPDNLMLLQMIAELLGYHSCCVTSGNTAIRILHETQPTIVLLDIVLADMNGFAVLQAIRTHKYLGAIPVIAVTGLAHERDRQKIIAAGFDDYVCKPYLISELETTIERHLLKFVAAS